MVLLEWAAEATLHQTPSLSRPKSPEIVMIVKSLWSCWQSGSYPGTHSSWGNLEHGEPNQGTAPRMSQTTAQSQVRHGGQVVNTQALEPVPCV